MHICIGNLTIIVSDNGLSPGRRQAIIWTNTGILLIGTNCNEILIEIQIFSFKKTHLKMSSGKRQPFCLVLNVLRLIHTKIPSDRSELLSVWTKTHKLFTNCYPGEFFIEMLQSYYKNQCQWHNLFKVVILSVNCNPTGEWKHI